MQKSKNNESFYGYVLLHSQTDRALFHHGHIRDLLLLAGRTLNAAQFTGNGFAALRYPLAKQLVEEARALDKVKQTAAGFQRGQRVRIVRTSGATYEGVFVRVRNEAVLHLAQVTIFNRLGGVVNSRDRSPRKFPLSSVASIEVVTATC